MKTKNARPLKLLISTGQASVVCPINYVPSITLNITKDILETAEPQHAGNCMVAQGLRVRGATSLNVTAERVKFNYQGVRLSYDIPAKVAEKIKQFDTDKTKLKPFKFTLNSAGAFAAPIVTRKNVTKRGPTKVTKKRQNSGSRWCKRRFHGLKMLKTA